MTDSIYVRSEHLSSPPSLSSDRRAAKRWCILRTSGGQTLGLAKSLTEVAIEAWTPRRTFKRVKPGRCEMIDGRKPTIEIDAPILPTFVFARAIHLNDLAALSVDPTSLHADFHIMRHAGRYPLVGDHAVAGLRQAEADAAAELQALRDAETREERRRIRAEAANNDRERRRVLRAEHRHFAVGASVTVKDVGAFASMPGVVTSSDGQSAMVSFGGWLTVRIEAWQLADDQVQGARSVELAAE